MIIEVLICDKCGHVHRIETDKEDFVEKCKKEFNKTHDKCKKKIKGE